jgi:hypothetical protein
MGYSRYQQYAPVDWYLPKTDLQSLGFALESKQKRFDTGYEQAAKLGNISLDALPQHRGRANALLQNWQQEKDKIIESYNGDYAAAYRDINNLALNIDRDMKPGGEAAAIMAQKKVYQDWYDTAIKDKELTSEAVNQGASYYMNPNSKGYIGDLKQDPVTGAWGITTPEQILKWQSPDEAVQKSIDNLVADKYSKEWDSVRGLYKYTNKQTGESLAYDKVYETALRTMQLDPNLLAAMQQSAKFRNVSFDGKQYLHGLADSYGRTYSYNSQSTSQTTDADQVGLHLDRQRREDARQNQMLGQMQSIFNPKVGEMDYGQNNIKVDVQLKDIFPNENTFAQFGGGSGASEFAEIQRRKKLGLPISAISETASTLQTLLNSGKLASLNINSSLMATVLKDVNPNTPASEVLKRYNEAAKQVGGLQKGTYFALGEDQGKNIANQLLLGSQGQYTTIRVKDKNGVVNTIPYSEFIEKYKEDIYTKDGGLKDQYKNLNTLTKSSNGMNPSFAFKVGKDEIYMEAPPAYVKAHEPIVQLAQASQNPNGTAIYENGINLGMMSYNAVTKRYEPKSFAGTPIERQITYQKDSNGRLQAVEQLYQHHTNPETGQKYKTRLSIQHPNGEEPITLNRLEQEIDKLSFDQNFGHTTQDAKGNTFLFDYFNNKRLIGQ